MKTLLIGLDAASPSVLERLFDGGELPTVGTLGEFGVSGTLTSQIPPWTASAWPSLYTGTNPGKHGVFGFLDFEGYDWHVVNATTVRTPAIWEYLDYYGLTSVVVNVPVTHPPKPFDGALLPGYAAPENPICHPAGLLSEIREAISEYRIYASKDLEADEAIAWFRRLTRMRGEAFAYLIGQYEPEFGFVQFQQTDTVFHKRPGDFEAVRAVYREVDDQIAAIVNTANPDTVIVASDHGIGPYEGQTFRVNDYLDQTGDLTVKHSGKGMPTWVTVRDEQLREGSETTVAEPGSFADVVAIASKLGLTTERITSILDALGLTDVVSAHIPGSVHRAGTRQVDFPSSRAYMRDRIELGVRINLKGREPNGIVPKSAYGEFRKEVIKKLQTVETADGECVFDEVAPREDYFWGPATDRAVDIVTVPADFEFHLSSRLEGKPFGLITEPWHHKMDGILLATGTAIDPRESLNDAHIFDVAPTVLASLGVPTDRDMDGDPLPVVDASGERSHPLPSRQEVVVTDDTEVVQQLKELGYIEDK